MVGKTGDIIDAIIANQAAFHPVVPFTPGRDNLLLLDFTVNNKELADDMFDHTQQFTAYINRQLADAGAKFGIGGYAEHRTIYSSSRVFDPESPGDEPRRLHLGVDIWGKPYTPVMAPLNGIVHSFAFNDDIGDYGTTIILSHSLNGIHFYTLYGHLSLNSIKNMQEGDRIERGDTFAEFGIPVENGHWPPHLHFQVINDLEGWKGNYAGVCKYSEKEKYLNNCPDPDLILQMIKSL